MRTVVGDGKTALNCLRFSKAGNQIATGSVDGRVFILDLGEVINCFMFLMHNRMEVTIVLSQKLYVPRQDEWARLKNTLQELQLTSTEQVTADKLDSLQSASTLASSVPTGAPSVAATATTTS